jgi:hypothetical protein
MSAAQQCLEVEAPLLQERLSQTVARARDTNSRNHNKDHDSSNHNNSDSGHKNALINRWCSCCSREFQYTVA